MNINMLFILMNLIIFSTSTVLAMLETDQIEYTYCIQNIKSHIAIIWPRADGKDLEIEQIFNKYGTIKFKKIVTINQNQAYELFKLAHPKVTDLAKHFKEFFSHNLIEKPLRIYVVDFENLPI